MNFEKLFILRPQSVFKLLSGGVSDQFLVQEGFLAVVIQPARCLEFLCIEKIMGKGLGREFGSKYSIVFSSVQSLSRV